MRIEFIRKGHAMWRISQNSIATEWPNNQFAVEAKKFADAALEAWEERHETSLAALDRIMENIIGLVSAMEDEAGALRLAQELLNAAAHRMIHAGMIHADAEPPASEFSAEWLERLRDEFRTCAQMFLMVAEAAWHSLKAAARGHSPTAGPRDRGYRLTGARSGSASSN